MIFAARPPSGDTPSWHVSRHFLWPANGPGAGSQRTGDCSTPQHLRQVTEMRVGRAEDGVVLDDEGGNPKIVGGNGRAFLPQLQIKLRVVMRGLFVRQ